MSDLQFSPDSSQLFLTIKGNDFTRRPGWFVSFQVGKDHISRGVWTQPEGEITPFGFTIVPGMGSDVTLAYADVGGRGFGVATINKLGLHISNSSSFVRVQDAQELCWTAFSPRTGSLFLTDPVANMVTEVRVDSGGGGRVLAQYPVTGRPLDVTIASLRDEDVLFVLTPERRAVRVITILGVGRVKDNQEFVVGTEIGVPFETNAVGMAHYVMPKRSSGNELDDFPTVRNYKKEAIARLNTVF